MSNGPSAAAAGRAAVNSVVVLMLENRSFDHMPGFLYPNSTSPSGQPYDGLTGTESSPGSDGKPVTVFKIEPGTPSVCYMPGADPGEGYLATNDQLYGTDKGPASSGQAATGQGFVTDYACTLGWEAKEGASLMNWAGNGLPMQLASAKPSKSGNRLSSLKPSSGSHIPFSATLSCAGTKISAAPGDRTGAAQADAALAQPD